MANPLTNKQNAAGQTAAWTYSANGIVQSLTLGNGAFTNFSHNQLGQLAAIVNFMPDQQTQLSNFNFLVHDGMGNLLTLTANVAGAQNLSGNVAYTYDGLDQLTQEQSSRGGGYTNNFTYDTAGNPLAFKGTAHTFNVNNQLSDAGYQYDNNGNPTTYQHNALTFDINNGLTKYVNQAGATLLTAGYTGDGLRAWKLGASGAPIYFLYDGDTVLAEFNSAGTVTALNTWGPTGLLVRDDARGDVWYTYDAQGNVAQRLNDACTVLSSDLYDAYGNLLSGGDSSDPYGYNAAAGYYTDHETGLMLCTHRYYDPTLGRWINRDPIGYDGGINLYGYCENDPVNNIDVYGLAWGVNIEYNVPLTANGIRISSDMIRQGIAGLLNISVAQHMFGIDSIDASRAARFFWDTNNNQNSTCHNYLNGLRAGQFPSTPPPMPKASDVVTSVISNAMPNLLPKKELGLFIYKTANQILSNDYIQKDWSANYYQNLYNLYGNFGLYNYYSQPTNDPTGVNKISITVTYTWGGN